MQPELNDVIISGDLEQLRKEIKGGRDPAQPSEIFKVTTLHIAASNRQYEIARYLVSLDIDINAADKTGDTPLHWATEAGDIEMCRILIKGGADINRRNRLGESALFTAAVISPEITEFLLEAGADAMQNETIYGSYPAHTAAAAGRIETFRLLIKPLNNINITCSNTGNTPLHIAARNNQVEMILYLLSEKADYTAHNRDGETPLHSAVLMNRYDAVNAMLQSRVDLLTTDRFGDTVLHTAAFTENYELLDLLLENGADINAENTTGQTAIFMSSAHDLIERLIAAGADVTQRDTAGFTLLHRAVVSNDIELTAFFIGAGIDVDATDEIEQVTPLHIAASEGRYEIAEFLISRGAGINLQTAGGETPLHLTLVPCETAGFISKLNSMVELLLERGADAGITDSAGWSPLKKAVIYDRPGAVNLLISAGNDLNAFDSEGETLLHTAVMFSSVKSLQILLRKYENIDIFNKWGESPLHLAVRKGDAEITALLLQNGADKNLKTEGGISVTGLTDDEKILALI